MIITDPDDERLADFFELADPAARRRRERDELFVAEGLIAVRRLIDSTHQVRSILVTPRHRGRIEALPGVAGANVLVADEDVVARTVGFHFHRGVIASAQRRPLPSVADVVRTSRRIAVLEGLNDPENLGLIARSARAFGIEALVLDPTCIDPYYRRTVRVSMGEVLLLAVARCDEWPAGIDVLHDAGFETWALTPDRRASSLWEATPPTSSPSSSAPKGRVSAPLSCNAPSRRVRIPISRDVDSLNVGHAAAVVFAVTGPRR